MHAIFIAELAVMPLALLAALRESIAVKPLSVIDNNITTSDGDVLSREDITQEIIDYVNTLTESELKDQFTLETCFIAHVSNIALDLDDDDTTSPKIWPHSLSLVKYAEVDLDTDYDDDQAEETMGSLDDDISDKIGYCFTSCTVELEKYVPYTGGTVPAQG